MNMTSLFPRVFSLFRLASFPAGLAGLALICCLLCQAAPVRAATIVYPDDGTALANVPGLGALTNSLFPGTSLSGNSVTVGALNGAATPNHVLGGVSAGAGVVENNRVFINSGAGVATDVFGGSSENGEARFNSVVMSGGTVSLHVFGGLSSNAAAAYNSVVISGGTVDGNVYGGFSANGAATNNSVVISGGTVGGDVFGGLSGAAATTHNTITLAGSPNLTASVIFGGLAATDQFTGNTLNSFGFSGSVKGMRNFEFYNFLLPNTLPAGGTLIAITGAPIPNMGNTKIAIGPMLGGGQALAPGDEVVLLSKTDGAGDPYAFQNLPKGFSLLYDLQTYYGAGPDNALIAGVRDVRVDPRTKSVAESLIAPLALVNQGGDLIAGEGMRAALSSDFLPGSRVSAYLAASGGWSRYDSGSHVDVSGASLIAGLAWRPELPSGKLALGPFFEAGWGSYNTTNSFSNAADVDGDGSTEYYGGGLLGRYDAPCGVYVEASGRVGGVHNDYDSDDLRDPLTDRRAEYDKTRTYYGAHAGLGYVWNFNDQASLDVYTKYFWTHQEGFSTDVGEDPYKFDDADSHRLRGGARFSYAVNDRFTPYIGAAYEHEFDGKIKATTYGGYRVDRPDLEGGTGIGELGFTLRPCGAGAGAAGGAGAGAAGGAGGACSGAAAGLSFDLGAQGYVGVREGVTGSLRMKWEF